MTKVLKLYTEYLAVAVFGMIAGCYAIWLLLEPHFVLQLTLLAVVAYWLSFFLRLKIFLRRGWSQSGLELIKPIPGRESTERSLELVKAIAGSKYTEHDLLFLGQIAAGRPIESLPIYERVTVPGIC